MPDSEPTSNPTRALSDAAVGAVVAMVRVAELYDPAVAHRAALRAIVADRLVAALRPGADRSEAVASAALADIDLVVSRPADPEAANESTRSLLGATIVGRIPGLRTVSISVGARAARWDGGEGVDSSDEAGGMVGDEIPFNARVIAVTDCLVGNPAAGFVPTWTHALRRVHRNGGTSLDPQMTQTIQGIDLEDISAPAIPSAVVLDLLEAPVAEGSGTDGSATATTIRSAVAAAGRAETLLTLFAEAAMQTVSAAEVSVMRLSPTQLDDLPIARVVDGQLPELDQSRYDDLREFTMQAELRAGVALTRSSTQMTEPVHVGERPHIDEVVVPIIVGGEAWGVLIASRRSDEAPFDAHDVSILRHIASEAAEAVSSTTHWAEMEQMALRDQLTGLANRHELYRVLDALFERPALERVDSALIMCDVDGLKTVNDTMGHHAGDRLLIDAAAALRGAVRDTDRTTVCRIGGDEFCMVIDGGALLTAHDVSDMIERLFARSAGSGPLRSISCGIAFASEEVDSRSALLRAADENQYQTKRARKAERLSAEEELKAAAEGQTIERRAIRD